MSRPTGFRSSLAARRQKSRHQRRNAQRSQLFVENLEERRLLAYDTTVMADNPIAYWRFEETSGTVAADSATANGAQNGTYINTTLGAASATPQLGRAASFNGTTSNVRVTDSPVFDLGTGAFTVEFWANTNVTGRGDFFTYKGAGGDFGIHSNSNVGAAASLYHDGFRLDSPNPVTVGQWNHVVVARYGTGADQIWMFINGQLVDTGTDPQTMNIANDILIGANHTGNPSNIAIPFNGRIDEVAVYNYGLPAGRIQAHYQAAFAADGVADSYSVNEDTVLNVAAAGVLANDVGTGGPITVVPQTVTQPAQGTVAVNANGSFTYNQNGAFNSLAQGQTANVSFNYQFVDSSGTTQDVVIARTGPGGTWHGYMLVPTTLTWDQARIAAQNFSFGGAKGHLMSITSWEEQQVAVTLGRGAGVGEAWIGLTDAGGISTLDNREPAPNATEGNNTSGAPTQLGTPPLANNQRGFGWQWVTGEPVIFQNWNPGEPNGGTGESAAQINFNVGRNADNPGFSQGAWNDLPAGSTLGEGNATQPSYIVEFPINQPLNEIAQAGWLVNVYHARGGNMDGPNNSGNSGLANAYALINSGRAPTATVNATVADFFESGGAGRFGFNNPIPGGIGDQFAMQVTGTLNVTTAGFYSFGTNTDDGAGIRIDIDGDGQLETVHVDDTFQGTTNRINPGVYLPAGQHAFEWVWFEGGGGASGEAFYKAGIELNRDAGGYVPIGDPSQGISLVGTMTARTFALSGGTTTNNLAEMDALIDPNGSIQRRGNGWVTAISPTINFLNEGGAGMFGADRRVPGLPNSSDNFAVQATGFVYIPSAGPYTFAVNSDDGFRLTIGGGATLGLIGGQGGTEAVAGSLQFPNGRGVDNSFGVWTFPAAGFYPIEMRTWEGGGGAAVEVFAVQGSFTSFQASMRLVGDTVGGGLMILPNLAATTATVTVVGVNDAPTANAGGPYNITEGGANVVLNAGASSDPDNGAILTYAWDLDGDMDFNDGVTGVSPSVSWATLDGLGLDGNNPAAAVTVRVRVTDQFGAQSVASSTLNILNAPPVGSITGPTAGGRGQPLNFNFSANDPSTVDNNAGFTYEVLDWGDGQSEAPENAGPAGIDKTHTYNSLGTKTITLQVTDADGGVSVVTHDVEIQAVFVDDNGNLIVGGTGDADRIILTQGSGGISVRIGNKTYPGMSPLGGVIRVFGGGGNDTISTAGKFTQGIQVFGGDGNDYITGTANEDLLDGGNHNDRIQGLAGNDTLLGGNGVDTMSGGVGNDYMDGDASINDIELDDPSDPSLFVHGTGNDSMNGDGGNDTLLGGAGNDRLTAETGNDFANGQAGADIISGDQGNDLLLGGLGADTMYGRDGSDVLIGGEQGDIVNGGGGEDLLIGDIVDEMIALDIYMDWLLVGTAGAQQIFDTYVTGGMIDDDLSAPDLLAGETSNDYFMNFLSDKIKDKKSGDVRNNDLI